MMRSFDGARGRRWRRATQALLAVLVLAGAACSGGADDVTAVAANAVPQSSDDPL